MAGGSVLCVFCSVWLAGGANGQSARFNWIASERTELSPNPAAEGEPEPKDANCLAPG